MYKGSGTWWLTRAGISVTASCCFLKYELLWDHLIYDLLSSPGSLWFFTFFWKKKFVSLRAIFVFFSFSVFLREVGKRRKSRYPEFYEKKTKKDTKKKIVILSTKFFGQIYILEVPSELLHCFLLESLDVSCFMEKFMVSEKRIFFQSTNKAQDWLCLKICIYFFWMNLPISYKMTLLWNVYRDTIFFNGLNTESKHFVFPFVLPTFFGWRTSAVHLTQFFLDIQTRLKQL